MTTDRKQQMIDDLEDDLAAADVEIEKLRAILSTFPACADTGLPAKWDDAIYYIQPGRGVTEFPYSDLAILPEHYGDPLPAIFSTREAAEAAMREAANGKA